MGFEVRGDSPHGHPMLWERDDELAPRRAEPSFERVGVLGWSLAVLATMAALGLAGGLLWAMLADPPAYTVSRQNAAMSEAESGKQFGVEVLYGSIAFALGLAAGLAAGWRLARYGWVLAVTLTLGGLGAAVTSLLIGQWFGPPAPSDVVTSASVGTEVPVQLTLESTGLLFVWSVAALVGLVLVVGVLTRGQGPSPEPFERTRERGASG